MSESPQEPGGLILVGASTVDECEGDSCVIADFRSINYSVTFPVTSTVGGAQDD